MHDLIQNEGITSSSSCLVRSN